MYTNPVIFAFVDVFTALGYLIYMVTRRTLTSIKAVSVFTNLGRSAFVGPSITLVDIYTTLFKLNLL